MKEWKAGRTYSVPLNELDLRLKHLHTPSQDSIEGMAASLNKRGQISPVIASIDSGQLILVDGFKRHGAALLTGLDPLTVMAVGTGCSIHQGPDLPDEPGKGLFHDRRGASYAGAG